VVVGNEQCCSFPAMIPLWMLPLSTVVGNTIVLKPSELVPGAVELIAQVVDEAKFPPGVFNVVQVSCIPIPRRII